MGIRIGWALSTFSTASLLALGAAEAAPVPVSNTTELLDAIANASPGDEIILADGTYAIGQNVNCSAAGTPAEPIVVRAENPLGAKIEFDAVEGFKVDAPHWQFVDLDIQGVCADDSTCEHAFHVVGAADFFVMRGLRVLDFNAQLKVNAADVGGTPTMPNDGLVERCDLGDTDGRQTGNPVTKLNIDGGDRWIVRDNYIHDFHKDGGNTISYGAFMKSGGNDGVFERNLVICDDGASVGGARIGLSFGGGGTANQFCAPAFDPNVPCDPEHTGGTMRNNIIVSCSDVGIYLNRSTNTAIYYNTLIANTGIDFRFPSTNGDATGNVLSDTIRDRDGASHTEGINLLNVPLSDFDAWYADPVNGFLDLTAEPTPLLGMGPALVSDDYCGRDRPDDNLTLGALESSLGSCDTNPPPGGGGGEGGAGGNGGSGASSGSGGSGASSTGAGLPSGGSGAGNAEGPDSEDGGGCGCHVVGDGPEGGWLALLGLVTGLGAAARGASRKNVTKSYRSARDTATHPHPNVTKSYR